MLKKLLLISFTWLALVACTPSSANPSDAVATVVSDTLDNGLFYEVHAKQENSDKIELRLMIKSGSLSETVDQSGYAHLLEHMAFNGTKNFPKLEIIKLFEKSGLTFGHDINAYTDFDVTVYTLSIPKSDNQLLADVLLYLHDILNEIQFDQAELDKEKGVVVGEYILRVPREKSYSYAFFTDYIADSEYEKRLPIGTLESINSSTVTSIQEFYKTWYRPNNAKLLITGDINSKNMVTLIAKTFSTINESDNHKQQIIPTPPLLKTESQVYSSKVINFSETDLFFEFPLLNIKNSEDLSQAMKLNMLGELLNYRLNITNNQRKQPFNEIGFSNYKLLNNKDFGNIYINHQSDDFQQATEFIAQELARINQHGFSQVEFKQQLEQVKSQQTEVENNYLNKNSAQLADDAIEAWSKGNIEYTFEIEQQAYQALLATISLQEINLLAKQMINLPSKLTFAVPYQSSKPDAAMLDKKFSESLKQPIINTEIKIEKLSLPKVTQKISNNKIERENFYPKQNITQWQLSNGVDVILQPDHSIKNSISISMTAPGGRNVLTNDQLIALEFLINSYEKSGLAGLSAQNLKQKFNTTKTSLIPVVEDNFHGFVMHTVNKPKSLEFLFSMVNSAISDAKIKESIFTLEKKRVIEHQQNYFKEAINSTIEKAISILSNDNERDKAPTVEKLLTVQQFDVESLYETLFSSANGYKLTIVGDFSVKSIKAYILQFIATLPKGKLHAFNTKSNIFINKAAELQENTNPQDNALLLLWAITDTPNQSIKEVYQAELLQGILNQTLTKIVREELSLTYSPDAVVYDQQAGIRNTEVLISAVTKEEDAKRTMQVFNNIINNFLNNGITQEQLTDQKNALQQWFDEQLQASSTRQRLLHRDHLLGFELGSTENAPITLNTISIDDMNQFIKAYLDPQKTLQVIVLPEK